jgi:hypothetical protein
MPRLKPPPGRNASARVAEVPDNETTDVLAQDQDNEIVIEDNSPQEEDASVAFQKQIDALKRSEQAARERAEQANREREEAITRAKAREAEVNQLRKTTVESQVEAISSSLAAANSAAMAAQHELAQAIEEANVQAQVAAHRKLAKAEADIATLEAGKAELEERAKAPVVEAPQERSDPLAALPPNAQALLRARPDYMSNPRLNAKLNAIHYDLLDEGYEAYSDEYIEIIRERMEPKRKAPVEEPEEEDVQPQRRATVSAPVSREAPVTSSGERPGRITLTALQKEAAKIAGITEVEYAKNLQRLKAEKANGNYTGGQ